MEQRRFAVYTALSEMSNGDIIELPLLNDRHQQPQLLKQGDIVHGSSQKIRSKVTDPSLGITIDHALTLERNTEFCQWQEFQSESCQTCSRDIHTKDGSGRSHTETEHYECDCVVQYDYYKTWRSYLINSLLFDQPAAHHNPQRNPLPSSYLVSNDALMEFTSTHTDADHHRHHADADVDSRSMSVKARISPAMLARRVNGASARTVKWVRNGIPPIPSFWNRWIPDRSRYEDVRNLDNTYGYDRMSMSNTDERFAYVGDGFFFSPHEPSKMERMFKVFGEYLEGSLFDWQLGDIFPSCTPGDIRIRYSVQDPDVVSVLGYAGKVHVHANAFLFKKEMFVELEPIKTKNGELMSMVHSGFIGAPEMIEREDLQSRRMAIFFRILSCVWSIAVVRRIGDIAGYDIGKSTYLQQFQMTCAYWSFAIATICSKTWGVSRGGNILFSVSFVLLAMVIQNPLRRIHRRAKTKEKKNTRDNNASAWNDKSEWVEQ